MVGARIRLESPRAPRGQRLPPRRLDLFRLGRGNPQAARRRTWVRTGTEAAPSDLPTATASPGRHLHPFPGSAPCAQGADLLKAVQIRRVVPSTPDANDSADG